MIDTGNGMYSQFRCFELSAVAPAGTWHQDQFQLRQAAIECAQRLLALGWTNVLLQEVTADVMDGQDIGIGHQDITSEATAPSTVQAP